ncbi:FaeA/PapI family transcriptional regulator [Escherichia coli]|uniref:FaeA/PapI family transcriptional regulator n=1 Tax=Escherichia coli TaxID=562 RepID=UPI001FCE41DC|nr:FaeA/PapI family transcriptional regulator [Escherichia coli]
MTSLKTSIKTITYLSDTGCLEIQGASLTSDIASRLEMSAYQARHYLMCLEKEGKIGRTPLRRGARTLWEVARETEKY